MDVSDRYIVSLRGLPYSADQDDIRKFFDGQAVKEIHIVMQPDGRPSGDGLVEFDDADSLLKALAKHKQKIGSRWVEVKRTSSAVYDRATGAIQPDPVPVSADSQVVKLRGLPWSTTREEIEEFIGADNAPLGIHQPLGMNGRPSGLAFLEFATEEGASKATAKDKENLGARYIEVSKTTQDELIQCCGLESSGGYIRARGLPWATSDDEIEAFFAGAGVKPTGLINVARAIGSAFLEFASEEDLKKAMTLDKKDLGGRYVELFTTTFAEYKAVRANPPRDNYKRDNWGGGGGMQYTPYSGGGGNNMMMMMPLANFQQQMQQQMMQMMMGKMMGFGPVKKQGGGTW